MEEFAIRKPRRGSMRAALNKTKKGTPSEQAAIKLGKKAAKKALEEGSTPAQAKAIGKKLSMSQMDTNRSKTNVEALWLAASAVPIGGAVAKGAQAVKALGNLGAKKAIRKKAAKAMEGTPSKSNTPFRSRKGNENKSQEALKTSKVIPKKPSVRLKPPKRAPTKLNSKLKEAVLSTTAVPAILTANALLKNKTTETKKPTSVKKPTPVKKTVTVKKLVKDTLQDFIDEDDTPDDYTPPKKSKPDTRKTLMEAMFGGFKTGDFTARDQELKDGTMLTYDFPDSDDMKKGGKVRRRMGGKVRGYGKAQRGY